MRRSRQGWPERPLPGHSYHSSGDVTTWRKLRRVMGLNPKKFALDLLAARTFRALERLVRLLHQAREVRRLFALESASSETGRHRMLPPPKVNFFNANRARRRSTVSWIWSSWACVKTTRNSSPPIRPLMSDARVFSFRIVANPLSTSSPASCPYKNQRNLPEFVGRVRVPSSPAASSP